MNSAAKREGDKEVRLSWQPNWGLLVFAVLFLPLTISLGFWQLSRADEKRALLEEHQKRESSVPVDLDSLDLTSDQQYRRVIVQGHFIENRNILLENRIRQGQPGFEVLSAFAPKYRTAWLWVNRGWIAGSLDRDQLPSVPTINGEVRLVGHLYRQLSEPFTVGDERWRQQWPQVVQNFDPQWVSEFSGSSGLPYMLRLDANTLGALAVDWQIVNVMPEKHTGYAVQWFLMASALVILSVFANSNIGMVLKRKRHQGRE
jgi:cytochrome oxidase assembly protein ShyY1